MDPKKQIADPKKYLADMFTAMKAVNIDTSSEEIVRLVKVWQRLKRWYIEKHDRNPSAMAHPKKFFAQIYARKEWINFSKCRARIYRQSATYKRKAKKRNHDLYMNKLKAQRNAPEAKEARNARRRELYAQKIASSKKVSPLSDDTMAFGHGVSTRRAREGEQV